MNKHVSILTTLSVLGLVSSLAACGGDDAGGDNTSAEAIIQKYDCDGSPASGSCDQALCQIASSYSSTKTACDAAPGVANCDEIVACIDKFVLCFEAACNPGDTIDASATQCSTEYSNCLTSSGLGV